ncbi:MAG: ring-cleaving dioxygenase [Vicinamibacterales bacterium]
MGLIKGIHHITVCASTAQEDIDFMTRVAGQRLIKQTVLFDGRYAHYHLYYANANAEVGSVFTTFPYKRVPGRPGSGQIQSTAYSVPKGSLPFWVTHFKQHDVEHSGIQERLGHKFIRFRHPAGLLLEFVESATDTRAGWTTGEISADVANRGFFGPVLSVRELGEQERFLTEALGFSKTGSEGPYHQFEVGEGGAMRTLILHHEPDRNQGSWGFGAGTGHHIALEVDSDEALAEQKGLYEELGYTDCSEIKDRNYFHSIYVRSPGGILTECAATAEGGFTRDEDWENLGTSLLLPPWFEAQREQIVKMLDVVTVPQENLPTPEGVAARQATTKRSGGSSVATERSGAAASRRTSATFIGGDGGGAR